MSEYNFDGTNVKSAIACLAGGVPQTGKASAIQSSIVMYDSARNSDAATFTVTEIGTTGVYEVSTPYADLNRAAGDGLWVWTYSLLDHTFYPPFVSVQVSRQIGTVNTTNFAPTTTDVEVDGLSDTSTNHYKDALVTIIKSSGNKSELKKITASVLSNGRVKLTFGAMSAALSSGDKLEIIDR